jgi:hypothetical protein
MIPILTCIKTAFMISLWRLGVYADMVKKEQVLKVGYIGPFSPYRDGNTTQEKFTYDVLMSVGATQCINGLKWYIDKVNNDTRSALSSELSSILILLFLCYSILPNTRIELVGKE